MIEKTLGFLSMFDWLRAIRALGRVVLRRGDPVVMDNIDELFPAGFHEYNRTSQTFSLG